MITKSLASPVDAFMLLLCAHSSSVPGSFTREQKFLFREVYTKLKPAPTLFSTERGVWHTRRNGSQNIFTENTRHGSFLIVSGQYVCQRRVALISSSLFLEVWCCVPRSLNRCSLPRAPGIIRLHLEERVVETEDAKNLTKISPVSPGIICVLVVEIWVVTERA